MNTRSSRLPALSKRSMIEMNPGEGVLEVCRRHTVGVSREGDGVRERTDSGKWNLYSLFHSLKVHPQLMRLGIKCTGADSGRSFSRRWFFKWSWLHCGSCVLVSEELSNGSNPAFSEKWFYSSTKVVSSSNGPMTNFYSDCYLECNNLLLYL